MKIGPPEQGCSYEIWWTVNGLSWLLYSLDTYEAAKIAYLKVFPDSREHVTVIQVSRRMVGELWDEDKPTG